MAEIPFNGPSESRSKRESAGVIANYAGGAVSLALIVGIGIWGYKLLSRDVSGVPVVRAASETPMRVLPESPGGDEAAHQGLSVNNVMAEGTAEKPADQLVLAPKPVELTEEDTPLEIAVAVQPSLPAPEPEAVEEPLSPQMASIRALADQLANGVSPLAETADSSETTTITESVEEVVAVAVETAAINDATPVETLTVAAPEVVPQEVAMQQISGRSLRPKMRPQVVQAVATVAPAAASTEVDTSSIPAGTRLVQLGAFESADVAREEWARLNSRFEDYLDGKQRVVMRAKSGGRVFYRLRAMGFADLSDARRFCAALVAEKADCIPVVSK